MSDITRDDLRAHYREDGLHLYRGLTDEEFDRLAREAGYLKGSGYMESQVLAWIAENPGKALRALLTDECQPCADVSCPCRDGDLCHFSGDDPMEPKHQCHRGWLPKDGVTLQEAWEERTNDDVPVLSVPFDWLEAEDER